MGAVNISNTGSGAAVTLSSNGTSLLLNGTAIGGGGGVTSVSGSSPIASSGGTTPTISLGIVPVNYGGTGTSTPSLVAGTNVTISGSWPNQTINSSGGGGSGLTWYSNPSSGSGISLTPTLAGTSTSGQKVIIAIVGESSLALFNISPFNIGGAPANYVGNASGSNASIYYYEASTGFTMGSVGTINISFSSYFGFAMAAAWVTTTNSMNMTSSTGSSTSSTSVFVSDNPSYQKGVRTIFATNNPSLNMTTAVTLPGTWQSLGTATHTTSSTLTLAAFQAPDPYTSGTSFSITNPSFVDYVYNTVYNS